MGWTLSELDEQDMTRVLPALRLTNIRGALQRCMQYLETQGKYKPSEEDWETWRWVNEQIQDV